MAADVIFFYMHLNWALLYDLVIVQGIEKDFYFKRGHKGQFICIQKTIKSVAIF